MTSETTSTVVKIGIVLERTENGKPASAKTAKTIKFEQRTMINEINRGDQLEKIMARTAKVAINPRITKFRTSA
ncbi:hypothetical protein D3C87_1337680 [compost metagenome]